MKKIWVYLLGVLTGIVVSIVVLGIAASAVNAKNAPDGMTFFESPGDIIEHSSVKVFQALGDGTALAESKGNGSYIYNGPNVLLYNKDGIPYYDEQVVNAPKDKCFRQVGIYRYPAKSGDDKTVPIVMLLEKKNMKL